ncbi:hypothetical protein DFJ58DRAFT_732476 [Suillus subalutaceus]|uniref:uncharacterized protein n=1 Tax=Suillus subalutaceus TaxID=48586 RepID=UPI001B8746AC|nr:uncharacterized protein DFJ58DRAFT_732476 [Suillus subalutaceus]KAG1841301.1 hypothetical protein DFJ58DRAFT_732476 [Suillus subalutaceus]
MPQHHHAHGEDFTRDLANIDSSSDATDSTDSDGDESNNDTDLLQVRNAIAAPPLNASAEDIRKANMRGKYREALKKNALLEATLSKGRKTKLTNKDLALAAKEDIIKNYGRKFSVMHCLWVETTIFPLRAPPPNIDLTSKERWLSPMSIQDGVKAELFRFILPADHGMMAHKNFGSHASIVFARKWFQMSSPAQLPFSILTQSSSSEGMHGIQSLHAAPCSLTLKILKASLFGRSSLAANAPPTPKTKAKIWELRCVTPGLIAAAAIVAIFILSGDKELVEIGDKSRISYKEYHNYYRQSLMTGGAWADSIYTFFNNSLFATSSSTTTLLGDLRGENTLRNTWEQDFERAMEMGGDLPEPDVPRAASPLTEEDAPLSTANSVAIDKTPIIVGTPQSISAAMQGLAMAEDRKLLIPPIDNTAALNEGSQPPIPLVQKPKPKPKPRRKTKAGAGAEGPGAAAEDLEVRRSGRSKK